MRKAWGKRVGRGGNAAGVEIVKKMKKRAKKIAEIYLCSGK